MLVFSTIKRKSAKQFLGYREYFDRVKVANRGFISITEFYEFYFSQKEHNPQAIIAYFLDFLQKYSTKNP